jgi:hypothetical protein
MINSWATSVNEDKNSSNFFNPLVPQAAPKMGHFPSQGPGMEDYKKYGWLFGGR